jgi:transcriptional regulator with XRE-family HTH domain
MEGKVVRCNAQLIRARIELCLTQLHVSRVIGIRPSLYEQWECGVQPHGQGEHVVALYHLCRLLGKELDELGLTPWQPRNEKLVSARRSLDLSTEQVVRRIAVIPELYWSWEQGNRPEGFLLQKMCQMFEKEPEDLGFEPCLRYEDGKAQRKGHPVVSYSG